MKCARGCMGVHEAVHEEMKCAQGCTGVHGSAWVSATWAMHDAREVHGGPTINGAQCDSGDGVVRSYQVPSKVQGKAGDTWEGSMKYAWRCMERADSRRSMEHACTALIEAETALTCPLQQSCMAIHGEHMETQPPMGLKGASGDGGRAIISGSEQGAGRGRERM